MQLILNARMKERAFPLRIARLEFKGRFPLGEKYRTERKFALENFQEEILFDFHTVGCCERKFKTRENQISKTKMAGMKQEQLRRLLVLIVLRRRLRRQNEKYKKCFWMRRIYQERILKGEFHLLIKEMILFDHEYFFRFFRMAPETFEKLLSWVSPYIQKKTTRMREPVSPSERLSVTLRYLVTGDEQISIAASYRISPSTVGRIIGETCKVLWQVLIEKGY